MAEYKSLVKKISVSPEMKTKQKNYLKEGNLRIIDQGQDLIGGYTNDVSKKIQCKLPVVVFGDHTRIVKYIDFPFSAGADGIKILQPQENILPKFLFYGTQYLVFCIENRGYARHYQYIEKENLTTPPLTEQRRIVAKIEELFSELDKGVAELQKVKAQLKVYRQAVLKEAFNIGNTTKVKDVCLDVTDGDHLPPPKSICGIPFIMISDIKEQKICWENTHYVNTEYYQQIADKRKPQKGDVLYTVTGSYGIPILIDFEIKFCFQRHIALLRPNQNILQEYLFYVMQSPYVYRQATLKATGTAQKTVALSVLREIDIPIVSIEMQRKIVSQIKSCLSVCDKIEQTVDESLKKAEHLRQSILKQAFEGKLV